LLFRLHNKRIASPEVIEFLKPIFDSRNLQLL